MSQIEDRQNRLTPEEQEALKKIAKGRPTVLSDERALKKLQSERIPNPVKAADIEDAAAREEKYGAADWTPPDLTLRPAKQKQHSSVLWDALQRFAHLSEADIEAFKARYPKFLPPWFYTLPCGDRGEHQQAAGLQAWQVWRTLLREAWHSGFHPDYVAQLLNIPTVPPGNSCFEIQPACDAQRAVLWMMLDSWRARFCPRCGAPFVARKPRDTYWPKECFDEQRSENQRASRRKRYRERQKSLSQKHHRRTKR